jgi:hypothetical protein
VNSLEDGGVFTNVTRWGETKTANKTSRQVGKNVTIPDVSTSITCHSITHKFGMTMTRSANGAGSVAILRQTRSRRSSVYLMSGYSLATSRQAFKNIPSDIFLIVRYSFESL